MNWLLSWPWAWDYRERQPASLSHVPFIPSLFPTLSLQCSPFGTLFRFRQMALCASVNLHLVIEMSGARQTERPAEAKDQNETDKGNQKRKGMRVHAVTKLRYPKICCGKSLRYILQF